MTAEAQHPLDPCAIAAFAARQEITDALAAAEAWASLTPDGRAKWRMIADAVLMMRDASQPAITVTPPNTVTAAGTYLGPAAHTWTAACAGHHPIAEQCPQPVTGYGPDADALRAEVQADNAKDKLIAELRAIVLAMATAIRNDMRGNGRIARSEVIDWCEQAGVEFDIYAEGDGE